MRGVLRKFLKFLIIAAGVVAVLVIAYFASEFVTTEHLPSGHASTATVAAADPAYAGAIGEARKIIDKKAIEFPGLAVAVSIGDQIVWSEARGYADIGNRIAATPQTIFRIYSTSKAITGTAAEKLIEDGKLELDAPVSKYLPNTPGPLGKARVWNLISHTAGIRDYYPYEWFIVSAKRCNTTDEALSSFIKDELDSDPGSRFTYSSNEYVLLSAVMETAAGMPFAKLLQATVFEPSEMHSTYLAPESMPGREAVSYREGMGGGFINAFWLDNSCKCGAGAIWSTAEDLVRFGAAVLGGRIVANDDIPRLFTSFKTTDGKLIDYGMGWGISTAKEGPRYAAHSGGGMGGRAAVVVFPDDGVSVAIVANIEGSRVVGDAEDIGKLFVAKLPNKREPPAKAP